MKRLVAAICLVLAVPAGATARSPLPLEEPTGIAAAADGQLLVVESGRHRLVRIDPSTGRERQIATFGQPWGVAAFGGAAYVGDGPAVVRVDPSGAKSTLATVAGEQVGAIAIAANGDVFFTTGAALYRLPGGVAGRPQRLDVGTALAVPHGLAVRPDGTLLVSDTNHNRLLVVDPGNGAVTTFAQLGHPRGVAVAADGTVTVVAADAHRVVRIDGRGRQLGPAGPRFDDPYALAQARDGTVYALEAGPVGFIRRIVPDGSASVVGLSPWTTAPPLPSPRSAHAVVVAGGAIHVLGGPATGRVDRFDGRTWTTESRLPGGILNAPAAVALGPKIYVIGGFRGVTDLPTAAVRVFDTRTRVWSAAPPLPAPRGGAAAVVLDGRIHVLGGGNEFSTIADHSVFDPTTGRWTSAAPLPRAEGSPAAVVLGGKIVAIGGRSGPSDFGATYVYDPSTNRWTRGPGIPPRGTEGAATWQGAIYLFGGESQRTGTVLGDVLRLAPGATAWRRVASLLVPRNYARSVVYRGRIYVVGGSTTAGDPHSAAGSRIVESFDPRRL